MYSTSEREREFKSKTSVLSILPQNLHSLLKHFQYKAHPDSDLWVLTLSTMFQGYPRTDTLPDKLSTQ